MDLKGLDKVCSTPRRPYTSAIGSGWAPWTSQAPNPLACTLRCPCGPIPYRSCHFLFRFPASLFCPFGPFCL